MPSEWENNSSSSSAKVSSSSGSSLSASSSTATSPEPNSNGNNNNNDSAKNGHAKDCALKASTMSHDPTPYVARARVTRPTPPKPSCNPMQFVQIKPCNLYQSAQQQLKKVEEIKKVKEVLKEEPEDWQNNLDNWKSSRRKRVEHIIERVVEVKKLELEEHDRTRRKSKTFSEMMEERGERGRTRPKLQSLASYNEDEANDLSDLGIGTSSASGKSSISEDCEVHSIVSEPPDVEHLSSFDIENNSCQPCQDNLDRISSLGGYETSSTAPITSPDPYEYTYEGAIEDYKSRVSKASAASSYKKPEFENRKSLIINDDNNDQDSSIVVQVKKEDLPKIDISKKRELFENQNQEAAKVTSSMQNNHEQMEKKRIPSEFTNVRSIKDRLCSLEKKPIDSNPNTDESSSSTTVVATEILPGEVYSIKERMQCLKQHNSVNPKPNINKVVAEVVSVPPLKDRLSSLQNAVTKEEIIKKPVVLVDEYQLEMLKNEDMARRQLVEQSKDDSIIIVEKAPSDDSGINTTDEKIDHEPATTEDEDDDDDADDDDDDITVAMTAPIPSKFNEEKLKNLNTPTVVSLVDKPVVVNDDHNHDDVVVGGGGVDDGGGVGKVDVVVNPKNNDNDEVCEVNHAQNLLKMFKLAFNDENDIDIVKESVKSDQVEVELDTLSSNMSPKRLPIKVKENVEKSISTEKSKVADISKNLTKISKTEDIIKPNEVEEVNMFKKISSNSRFGPRSPEPDSNVILNIDNSQNKSPNFLSIAEDSEDPSYVRTSVSSKIQQLNKISSDSQKGPISDKSPNQILISKTQQKPNPPSSPILIKAPTQQNPNSPSSPILIRAPTSPSHESSESPPKFVSVSSQVQQLNSISAATQENLLENSRKLKNSAPSAMTKINVPSSPISNRTPSPSADSNSSQKSPIYENINASYQNLSGGVKVVSNSENNGRVEIFNSKNMPAKPKSPEVLPRMPRNENCNVQSKDFQQSALNDFIKDLETTPFQVDEKVNIEKNPQIIKEGPESPSNLKIENTHATNESSQKIKPLETKPIPLPRNLGLNSPQPMSPLPLDSCVDILQSFLAAERPAKHPTNELPLVKSPSELNTPHPSDSFIRQESIVEVPCSKLDVKDLPDPNFIRTPCINVDNCEDKLIKESIKPPQSLVRDSVSSAGDSSPSSDITVIFKSAPESPTPNKSSLMEIANRMGSPIAARRDPFSRQKPVCEKPCLKIDVKDLPDPNFIRTECIDVDKNACCPNTPLTPSTPGLALQKTNADILKKTCEDISTSPPLSPVLGGRNAENPNFLIARVEVVETKIKVTTTNDEGGAAAPPAVPTTAPPPVPSNGSPKLKTKSTQNSKPKNIFEFLKKNFQSKPETVQQPDEFEPISVDNSMFYVPSDVISASTSNSSSPSKNTRSTPSPNNGVNIEITKKITSDAIVEQTDSDLNLTDEINEILDEEISKLVVEDAKL
ncbi:uncharacterized protein CG43427 isoform X1 [Episyrphus balteatus]|uniref:uncharacterized protein CG43427 isoform X1 n=1 Tax=Episyrphus balteatus TaxID=286459 RepID=UPI0024861A66|nr:uncharacterized protein CG43427 isoform X1 [Episyrphus balteatus]XP_055848414.1 uncharacterized protein CG43427 isoform X1 [Episyrphus balteatus]XP_055848415.1 uncharacterized protein CG43427 isoform X1 [Episyrphus balteatus]XP_055848417.1 uncharacterized protein CG43427 isoform X1 [Episyrphus balteatus]XP_055848418.1 uncharacterized protein CG43427 isoform X1 [Episyrphus balteatus]